MYIILIDNPGFFNNPGVCLYPGISAEAVVYSSKKEATKAGKELGFPFQVIRR